MFDFLEKEKDVRKKVKARISEIEAVISQFHGFLENDSIFVEESKYSIWRDKSEELDKLLKRLSPITGGCLKLLSYFKRYQNLKKAFFSQEDISLINQFRGTYNNSKDSIRQHNKKCELYKKILSSRGQIEKANCEFQQYLEDTFSYFNHLKYTQWKDKHSNIYKLLNISKAEMPKSLETDVDMLIDKFREFYIDGQVHIDRHNKAYVSNELEANKDLFNSLEKYPLNKKQKEAIVCDEDKTLIIAGAGTGKTTCIVGKVAYLLKKFDISPEEILLLAFNKDAVDDMRKRVEKAGGEIGEVLGKVAIRTFHRFGLEVIAEATGEKRRLAFENDEQLDFINTAFEDLLKADDYKSLVVDYLSCYLHPHKKQQSFETEGDYYKYLKAHGCRTFKDEPLKSQEEVAIANFLFLHNVEYEYERDYEFKTATQFHSQYQPDFYLPDYKIYIEHFGIDRTGNVPEWFSSKNGLSPKQCYNEGIKWKRETHQENSTTLIETYSYERSEGSLLKNLKKKLIAHNVNLKPKTKEGILQCLKQQKKSIPQLIYLFQTFLELAKSNGIKMEALKSNITNFNDSPRLLAFIEVFSPIYKHYEKHLRDIDKVDFSDMITKATGHIEKKEYKSPFKYILIDEFQDMSVGRYKLTKALVDQNPLQKLYCVGDDWQSIYRFTGSDISIITDFDRHFGYTKTIQLDTTYRFNQEVVDFTSKFIQQSPKQLKKKLSSDVVTESTPEYPPYEILDGDNALHDIMCRLQEDASVANGTNKTKVFIIGRYNFNKPENMPQLQQRFNRLNIEFTTAHKAKGRERDFVVITDMIRGKYGFPTEITDDPILNLVLECQDDFPNAEERRLFYVALTRAKKGIFLVTDRSKRSTFIDELDYATTFNYGDHVSHKKFGKGTVVGYHDRGENSVVEVNFISGRKSLMVKYAKLEKM